jgi:hypothetical protein
VPERSGDPVMITGQVSDWLLAFSCQQLVISNYLSRKDHRQMSGMLNQVKTGYQGMK